MLYMHISRSDLTSAALKPKYLEDKTQNIEIREVRFKIKFQRFRSLKISILKTIRDKIINLRDKNVQNDEFYMPAKFHANQITFERVMDP